jgi:enoyl-CoA hydratase/carnithine racemase
MDVLYEVREHIAVITLNRPKALNTFTDQMEAGLIQCFDRSDADDDVRVVVITGSGRAFCAGMELAPTESGRGTFEAWRTSPTAQPGTKDDVPGEALPLRRDGGGRLALRIFESTKPVIAAINGDAIGVGITMTLPCDIRVMADSARVAFPFTRRGFVPESCSTWFLPRIVPFPRAMEWMLTSRRIQALEAHEAGLVMSLHPADQVLTQAMSIARDIATSVAPVSTSLTRQMLWRMLTAEHPMSAHRIETRALNDRGISADALEGVEAFLGKRDPLFTDATSGNPDYFADLPHPTYIPIEAGHAPVTHPR